MQNLTDNTSDKYQDNADKKRVRRDNEQTCNEELCRTMEPLICSAEDLLADATLIKKYVHLVFPQWAEDATYFVYSAIHSAINFAIDESTLSLHDAQEHLQAEKLPPEGVNNYDVEKSIRDACQNSFIMSAIASYLPVTAAKILSKFSDKKRDEGHSVFISRNIYDEIIKMMRETAHYDPSEKEVKQLITLRDRAQLSVRLTERKWSRHSDKRDASAAMKFRVWDFETAGDKDVEPISKSTQKNSGLVLAGADVSFAAGVGTTVGVGSGLGVGSGGAALSGVFSAESDPVLGEVVNAPEKISGLVNGMSGATTGIMNSVVKLEESVTPEGILSMDDVKDILSRGDAIPISVVPTNLEDSSEVDSVLNLRIENSRAIINQLSAKLDKLALDAIKFSHRMQEDITLVLVNGESSFQRSAVSFRAYMNALHRLKTTIHNINHEKEVAAFLQRIQSQIAKCNKEITLDNLMSMILEVAVDAKTC